MKLIKKLLLLLSVKITIVVLLIGAIIAIIIGGFNTFIALLPQWDEMGLAYDNATNFYSVPVKLEEGIGSTYSPLSDFKTYDENAAILGDIKINGIFLANKKLKVVDRYLFMSSFNESDFENLLSSKTFYKMTQTGVIVGGTDKIDRTLYIVKNEFYSSGAIKNETKKSETFNLYSGYDATNDRKKYMADNLNFLKHTENNIPYFYFNFERAKHFGFLYPYRMSYGVILENTDSQNINQINDYSITDTILGGKFNLFSSDEKNSLVQSMTICENSTGQGPPICYKIPKQDTFEEGNSFYFRNNQLLGKEKDFESVYNLEYSYITIAGQQYISQIIGIPKTFNIDKDYISVLDKSFFKNSGGKVEILNKDYNITVSDKEYLIAESLRIIPKYFYIEKGLRGVLSKNELNEKYDYVLSEKNMVMNIHPYLLIHSFYQTYIGNQDNGVKIRSTGFSPSSKVLDTYSYIKDVGRDTIGQISTFSDGGVFSYSSFNENQDMKRDFQKNLDLIITGFDYKKTVARNSNENGTVPVVLLSSTSKPKDSTFMGLWNEKIANINYGLNLITVYGLFHHPGLSNELGNAEQESIKQEYKSSFEGQNATVNQETSFWGRAGDFLNQSAIISNDFNKSFERALLNPFKSISDNFSQSFNDGKTVYRNYSCDYSTKLKALKISFSNINTTIKQNYGNPQIERILLILEKNGISFVSIANDKDIKMNEIVAKSQSIVDIVGRINIEEDTVNKRILQKELYQIQQDVELLKKEISVAQEGTTLQIDDIIKNIENKIKLKISLIEILRQKVSVNSSGDSETQIAESMTELTILQSELTDLKDVKENYQTDIDKTFTILIAFQKYNELLREMTVIENCMITGDTNLEFVSKMKETQLQYDTNIGISNSLIKGYERSILFKNSELITLAKSLDISNEMDKDKILSLQSEIKSISASMIDERKNYDRIQNIKVENTNSLLEKYGSDKTIVLNYRNDKSYKSLLNERKNSDDIIQKLTLSKIKTIGSENANILKGYFTELKKYVLEYNDIKNKLDDADLRIFDITNKINSELDNVKKETLSNDLEQLNLEKIGYQVQSRIVESGFDTTKSVSNISNIGPINNISISFLDTKLQSISQDRQMLETMTGAIELVSENNNNLLFNKEQKDAINYITESEFKKKVLEDFRTGNFEHYYVAYDSLYELKQKSSWTDMFLKSTSDVISDMWTNGRNKDLALYYNLHVFYKGVFDLKSELDNNKNIITDEVYPIQKLTERFGTFGRFFFPNVSEGEFIIDNIDEFEQMSGLKLSISQNSERITALKGNLKKYIESMSLNDAFTGSGRYSDYGTNFGSGLVYKEILNETNIRFIKENPDTFGYYSSSGVVLSENLDVNSIISLFTDRASDMKNFYNEVSIRGFAQREKIDTFISQIKILKDGLIEAQKRGDIIMITSISAAITIYNNQYIILLQQDIVSFDTYYRAYLMSTYRKLLIAKYVDGNDTTISSDLLLPNEEAKMIYKEIQDLQKESIYSVGYSREVLNGQKNSFNKNIEEYKSSICSSYSDSETKRLCVDYINYLAIKPDIKSFLEEIEYSTSVAKLIQAAGWVFPSTKNFISVRSNIPPYNTINGGLVGQCVWYIQIKKKARGGNASSWGSQGTVLSPKGDFLSKLGRGDVVVFSEGEYGHIAIVEEVNETENKVRISESNYGKQGKITIRWIPADSWLISHYIVGIKDKYVGMD